MRINFTCVNSNITLTVYVRISCVYMYTLIRDNLPVKWMQHFYEYYLC